MDATTGLRLGVLGPLLVCVDGVVLPVTAGRQRAVLGSLLVRANEVVTVEELADLVWDGSPPPTARATARNYVKQLRRTLGPRYAERIVTRGQGYLFHAEDAELDRLAFAAFCRSGREAARAGEWHRAGEVFGRALDLWRGPALVDVSPEALHREEVPRLDRLRLDAVEGRVEADLRVGRHEAVIEELRLLLERHPLRERFHAQLMLALAGSGRRVEALEAYRQARRMIVEEVGVEPGQDLSDLHQRILRDDPKLRRAGGDRAGGDRAGITAAGARTDDAPRQLPAPVRHFTGRAEHVDLLAALADRTAGKALAVVISAVDGMAGIGKTALAVQTAHRLAGRYPDGQLFVDLHGFTEGVEPIEPDAALEGMLRSIGVAGEQIPPGVAERAALYRTRLAGKRVLVVLDNAATEAQVRPLLPGAPGCLVLVTSRRRLAGLDGAEPLSLDVLTVAEAAALFIDTVGAGRGAAAPDLVRRVADLCGRLPLAIRIAAARLRHRPEWTLAQLADLLQADPGPRGALQAGERSVAASIQLSCAALTADQRSMFRVLAVHPGADTDRYAAAALAGCDEQQAGRVLEDLCDANLLEPVTASRYRMHDLVRAYAGQLVHAEVSEPDRRAALTRLFDHYADTATAAVRTLYPDEAVRPRPDRASSAPALSEAAAATWLDSELPTLLTVAAQAAERWPAHTVALSNALHPHLDTRSRYADAVTLHDQALAAARRRPDRPGELSALIGLGDAQHRHRERVYHAAGRALVEDFGVEPGSRLRHLYEEILREDTDAAAAATGEVGAQLPPAAVPFVGRVAEFAELDRIVVGAATSGPGAVVVAGGAGLGKTALVVQWARHHAGDFPDGQVYVDMRGFTSGTPMTASEAMTHVLLALGVDSHCIPAEPAALQPFYRRLTAGRRLLVIFDDVAAVDQVRPALPTGLHTAALITSRRRLFGLTALGDASSVALPPLPPGDALALMFQLLPEHRDDRAALSELAVLCAYMPLFLRVSAANVRLCGDPASFAAAMHGNQALDHLQSGADPAVGARSALGLSYRSLPEDARRLFRAAGRAPVHFVTPDSAGAMLGMDPAQGRWLLERIADVHLIEQTGFGTYLMHDLIRAFAAEQDAGSDDEQALRRLMAFYALAVTHATETATAANTIVSPEQPEPGIAVPALLDPHAAMAWLDGELPNIAAVVRFAAEHGPPEPAWQISRQLTHYFWIRRRLPEWRAINEAALAAARAAGRPDAVAPMLTALAVTIWTTNDLDRTRSLFEEALALNLESGREAAQASNHTNLGSLCRQTGQLDAALAHTRTAVRLGRRHNRPLTVANALLNLASLHRDLGALYQASRTVDRALATYRSLGSTDGQISSLNVLAEIRCELGHHRAAQSAAEQSLEMADAFGSVHGSIFARQAMTDLLIATGRPEAGRELSEAALADAAEHGDRRLIITATLRLAAVLAALNCNDQARREAEQARGLAIEQHDLHGTVDAMLIMAQLPGEPQQALSLARAAERQAARAGLLLHEAKAQLVRAELSAADQDPTTARSATTQAWPVLRRSGAKPWITRCIDVMRRAPAPARTASHG